MMTSAKECRHYNDRETFILALRLFKFIKFIFNIKKKKICILLRRLISSANLGG